MTHEDAGHYAAKHPPGTPIDPAIETAVKNKAVDGKITCAAAHRIARTFQVAPAEVGKLIDLLELRICKCQLGLFGYRPQSKILTPAEKVNPEIAAILRASVVNHRLACAACWEIARDAGIAKFDAARATDALNIKISPCQLGAFG